MTYATEIKVTILEKQRLCGTGHISTMLVSVLIIPAFRHMSTGNRMRLSSTCDPVEGALPQTIEEKRYFIKHPLNSKYVFRTMDINILVR